MVWCNLIVFERVKNKKNKVYFWLLKFGIVLFLNFYALKMQRANRKWSQTYRAKIKHFEMQKANIQTN